MKYRILALLDKVTGHRIWFLCSWCWDYEMSQVDWSNPDLEEPDQDFWMELLRANPTWDRTINATQSTDR